ncbi:MAG: low molecular weight phosphatase family protein [Intrasporangium sp.]|uniref:arsenate reductase/protein-tyrosine-phosphatase family protein n=1 Tax=Intrasporangium sp. TaxID=1925024 RepID=UPI00264772EC|nr:low molecular weight phosphatase family protein [Intrasporangium sp.]MDN5797010.1 low molecular weight phosphatase family protein [Intrasporangium sp.]
MTRNSGVPAQPAESAGSEASARNGRVLVVCTGNVCRSPYMERRLAQVLEGTGVEVVSGGTAALVGQGMDPGTAHELGQVGVSVVGFVSTQVTAQRVGEADLVLTAAREHRATVAQLHAKALRYCFTWADFADLVDGLDPDGLGRPAPGQTWVSHVASLAAARRGTVPPRSKEQSDILDPYRLGSEEFSRMARQIEEDLPPIVAALSPPLRG